MSPQGDEVVRRYRLDAAARQVLSVTEVNRKVKAQVQAIGAVWVWGEASTVRRPASGHVYFNLKDHRSQLRCVLWRDVARRLPFRLDDGLEVVVFGRLTAYEPRGVYQISVEVVEPKGVGAAQLALEQLKKKLEKEGLFDPRRKRALPRFPAAIGLVTSATGAAVRDMLEVIERRWPVCRIVLRGVRVQGEQAALEVALALEEIGAYGDVDVVLVGRGGGSKEDLWAFNHERVARAIAACPVPVVSSVGHAIDTTIADLVADRQALTPTEAAELVTPVHADLLQQLSEYRARLGQALLRGVRGARERVDLLARSYALREPRERLARYAQRLDELGPRLARELRRLVRGARERTDHQAGRLESLSPLRVLARGYSLTQDLETGRTLTDAAALSAGALVRTRLARGAFTAEVREVEP